MEIKEKLTQQKNIYINIIHTILSKHIDQFSNIDINEEIEIADKILDIAIELDFLMRKGTISATSARLNLMQGIINTLNHYEFQKDLVTELRDLSIEQFNKKMEEEKYKCLQLLSLEIQKTF
ncbi:MAG: hypothetical protein RR202_05925 [Bacteroidales bacterium]